MNFRAQGPSICIHKGNFFYNVINISFTFSHRGVVICYHVGVFTFFKRGVVDSDVNAAVIPGAGPVLAGGEQGGDGCGGHSLGAGGGQRLRCSRLDGPSFRRSDALPW